MKMTNVSSSTIVAIGYNEKDQKLQINFKSGNYCYSDVPKTVYDALMNSESKGKFLFKNIKNKYRYERI